MIIDLSRRFFPHPKQLLAELLFATDTLSDRATAILVWELCIEGEMVCALA